MPNPSDAGLPNPASYDTTSTPGVVIDQLTGLLWQEPIDAQNDIGETCASGCTQDEARAYCADLTLAGQSDWRLPTRIELVSLVDFTRDQPAIDTAAFQSTPSAAFWTSSSLAGSDSSAWGVDFSNGLVGGHDDGNKFQVRCVH